MFINNFVTRKLQINDYILFKWMPKKFTKKIGSKSINTQYFYRKTRLEISFLKPYKVK